MKILKKNKTFKIELIIFKYNNLYNYLGLNNFFIYYINNK